MPVHRDVHTRTFRSYLGQESVRGILCDVWMTDSDAIQANAEERPPSGVTTPKPSDAGEGGAGNASSGGEGGGGGWPGAGGGGNSSAGPGGGAPMGPPFVMTYTLTYYFSSSEWSIPEDNSSQVPVRVVRVVTLMTHPLFFCG